MSRRSFTRIAVLVVLIAALGSYAAGAVLANHFVHQGMDKTKQWTSTATGGNTLPENYVSARWALDDKGTQITWHADNTSTKQVFEKALAKWMATTTSANPTTSAPDFRWAYESSKASADVYVFSSNLCGRGSAFGTFKISLWTSATSSSGWYSDDVRSANYWQKAEICLKLGPAGVRKAPDFRVSVAAHEIGHAYGLHEVYNDSGASDGICNSGVKSIMDGSHLNNPLLSRARLQHCDEVSGPTEWDIERIEDFFLEGGPVSFSHSISGNTATFTWKDDAWGEFSHEIIYRYRLDASDIDGQWIDYHTFSITDAVGRHIDIAPELIPGTTNKYQRNVIKFRHDIDLSVHSKVNSTRLLPLQTDYQICGRALFKQFGLHSSKRCSKRVTVSNEAHNKRIGTNERPTSTPTPTATRTPKPSLPRPRPPTATPTYTPTPEPPTATPEPPTATPEPPTATPEPPTATPEPPTATPEPTATRTPKPKPPTATPRPTATPHPCDVNPLDCPDWAPPPPTPTRAASYSDTRKTG